MINLITIKSNHGRVLFNIIDEYDNSIISRKGDLITIRMNNIHHKDYICDLHSEFVAEESILLDDNTYSIYGNYLIIYNREIAGWYIYDTVNWTKKSIIINELRIYHDHMHKFEVRIIASTINFVCLLDRLIYLSYDVLTGMPLHVPIIRDNNYGLDGCCVHIGIDRLTMWNSRDFYRLYKDGRMVVRKRFIDNHHSFSYQLSRDSRKLLLNYIDSSDNYNQIEVYSSDRILNISSRHIFIQSTGIREYVEGIIQVNNFWLLTIVDTSDNKIIHDEKMDACLEFTARIILHRNKLILRKLINGEKTDNVISVFENDYYVRRGELLPNNLSNLHDPFCDVVFA